MAEKTLRKFSAPSTENIHVGPTFNLGEYDYEIKPSLIKMVQVIILVERRMKMSLPICRIFWRLEIPLTFKVFLKMSCYFICFLSHYKEGRSSGFIRENQFKTWRECSEAFLEKFFPIGRTNILRGKISEFHQ